MKVFQLHLTYLYWPNVLWNDDDLHQMIVRSRSSFTFKASYFFIKTWDVTTTVWRHRHSDAKYLSGNISNVTLMILLQNEIIATKVIEVSIRDDGDLVFADSEQTESNGSDSEIDLHDYWYCAQCLAANNNPLYRYCEKCFKVRVWDRNCSFFKTIWVIPRFSLK